MPAPSFEPLNADKVVRSDYFLGYSAAVAEMAVRLDSLANFAARNADMSAYDLGLANGLLLATQACRSEDLKPLTAPDVWRSDKTLRGAYRRQRKDFLRNPPVAAVAALIAWSLA